MGLFTSAFQTIADGIKDLASLDVVTYKGSINLASLGDKADFSSILNNAKADASFRVIAATQSKLDGDTNTFYDSNASADEVAAHLALVESATAKRAAVVKMFESLIVDGVK